MMHVTDLPLEVRWLLDLCRAPDTPWPDAADAALVLNAVRHHRLVLPLGPSLLRHLPTAELQETATRFYRRQLHRAMLRAHLTATLAARLAADGVPLVSFKGTSFSALLGLPPTARGGRDIDLLVRPADVPCLARHLTDLGLQRVPEEHPWAESWYRPAANPSLLMLIEVHTRLTDPGMLPLTADQIIAQAVPVGINGQPVLTLPPTLALPYAAYHGFNHAWARLFWVKDFADAARAPAGLIDWEACWRSAETLGLQHFLGQAVALAQDVFHTPRPALSAYHAPLYSRATPLFLPGWTLPLPTVPETAFGRFLRGGALRFFYWSIRLSTGWRRLYPLVLMLRPTALDRGLIALPRWLAWLYWGLRPFRLLAVRGSRFCRGVLRRFSL